MATTIDLIPNGPKFRTVPASYWFDIKVVEKGPSWKNPEIKNPGFDDIWFDNPLIKTIRAKGGIFVNDHFLSLWDDTEGLQFLYGGYGSSKTTYAITRQLVKSMTHKYHRCFYGRNQKTEARNLHSNIITEIERNGWQDRFNYSKAANGTTKITCYDTGNTFELFGCDNEESLKGIDNPTDILLDEINQVDFKIFGMLVTRLRGQGYRTQFVAMFNNCDVMPEHWLKKYIFGNEDSNDPAERTVLEVLKEMNATKHHSNYLHNLFQNPAGYLNKLKLKAGGDPEKILAYARGDWGIKLNNQPYYKMFDQKKHVRPCFYNPALPLHISWDENKNPYLPCIITQISGTKVNIIEEIAGVNPENTLVAVCGKIRDKYSNHRAGMYIYGDATSKKEDVKLEKGENFFSLMMEYLRMFNPVLRIPDSNPSNKMRGNFINMIFSTGYESIDITISPDCLKLINDLENCPEDPNGKGKLKQTSMVDGIRGVQKWGHFGDCLDYLMCEHFVWQYILFQNGGETHAIVGGDRMTINTAEVDYRLKRIIDLQKKQDEDIDEDEIYLNYSGGRRCSSNGYS